MNRLKIITIVAFFGGICPFFGQVSADCVNAVPICSNTPVNGGTNGFGNDDFNGALTSGCLEQTITNAIESNSGWYRFRTGATGQLGFNIGINSNEDWDYALYRASDCNNLGEPIRCNFFDNQDQNTFIGVGEDPTGETANIQFEDWIQVAPGEDYYLLINNFSNSNSGFSIQFSGQIFKDDPLNALDCSIINNLLGPPIASCEGETITLNALTVVASTYNWYKDDGSGFELIMGQNNATLMVTDAAIYRVEVVTPSNNNIISDVQVGFSSVPVAFPVLDDVVCSAESSYDLSTKDTSVLGGQSPTDFVVSYHSTQADANAGVNFLTKEYTQIATSQRIYIRVSSAQNPNCFDATQSFQLSSVQTPELDFDDEVFLCDGEASITIGSLVALPDYTYSWSTGETTSSIDVSQPGSYKVTVENMQSGFSCSSMKEITVVISKPPTIAAIEIDDLQDNNTVRVLTDSDGNWEYQIDNEEYQLNNIFENVSPGRHTITVNDPIGCGVVSEDIVVAGFSKFFTPNGDGMNDQWTIEGMSHLDNPVISIYDKYGKLLYQMNENSAGWDGTFNGSLMPASDYWFKLTYTDSNGQITEAKYINNHFSLKR